MIRVGVPDLAGRRHRSLGDASMRGQQDTDIDRNRLEERYRLFPVASAFGQEYVLDLFMPINLDYELCVRSGRNLGWLAEDLRKHVPNFDNLKFYEGRPFGNNVTKANWKVVVDNYVECYHCSKAHPAFADGSVGRRPSPAHSFKPNGSA